MAILGLCSQCKRTGRYAEKETDKICKRCKQTRVSPKDPDPKEKIGEADETK